MIDRLENTPDPTFVYLEKLRKTLVASGATEYLQHLTRELKRLGDPNAIMIETTFQGVFQAVLFQLHPAPGDTPWSSLGVGVGVESEGTSLRVRYTDRGIWLYHNYNSLPPSVKTEADKKNLKKQIKDALGKAKPSSDGRFGIGRYSLRRQEEDWDVLEDEKYRVLIP